MDKRYNLKLDLQFRCNNSKMIFDEFDENTSDFFMQITRQGQLVDISNAIPTLLVLKPSGVAVSQVLNVKDNLVYGNLNNSLKNEVGTYIAKLMLIEGDKKTFISNISYEVTENALLGMIDDDIVEDERYSVLVQLIERLSDIESKEQDREEAEQNRQLNEQNREKTIQDIQNKIDEVLDKINNVGEGDFSTLATKEELNKLNEELETHTHEEYATKGEVPKKISELENDKKYLTKIPSEYVTETELNQKGYLTEHQDISHLATKKELFSKDYNDLTNKPTIPSIDGLATEEFVNEEIKKIDVTEQLTDYAKKTELHNHTNKTVLDGITSAKVQSWDNKSTFDGNYNSLTNKPSIPTKTSQLTNDSKFITSIPSEYITETELNAKGYATVNQMNNKADKVNGVFYIEGDSTTAGVWTGQHEDITEYYSGLMINYKTNVAGVSGGSTLNINNLGAVQVVRNVNTAVTTTYTVGCIINLTYTIDDGTAYWKVADYDVNTKNTTGTSNKTGSKMYIVGATSQTSSGTTTYTNTNCYIGTDNKLYSGGNKVVDTNELEAKGYLTEHQDISGKADKSEIPTKTSQLTNDSDFITKHQGSENAGKILAVDGNGDIVFEEMPEGSGEGKTETELLEFTYVKSYPNQTTFEYTTTTSQGGNWLYKKSTLLGGILSVDWDTALLTSVELILYLFDSEGNPYRYTQRYNSYGVNETIAGDKYPVTWMQPGTGSGFCIATGPFTIKIPDNCSVMLAMRGANAVFPSGSSLNNNNFYKQASSVFSVSVIKKASVTFAKVDVLQGVNNANRIMITNDKGEVVVGDINPNSIALRPNWDTVIHRGWVNGAKENTVPAFYLAKENGYSWVECDIRISSDGVPVLAHDTTITSEDGASVLTVAESTVSQLQSITLQNHERFGAIKMNTLAELLDMARCLGIKILLDIKVSGESAMKSIAKTVLRYGMSDNVIYMPMGTTNASHIKMVDKNASFDFVMYGTNPTSTTDLTGYASLLNGSNHVNLDIQANTWEFTPTVIDAINNVGLGLCAWNVTSENIGKCIDSGMLRITKHNNFDDVDLNTDYLKDKKFW